MGAHGMFTVNQRKKLRQWSEEASLLHAVSLERSVSELALSSDKESFPLENNTVERTEDVILVLENVRTPANVGMLYRTADRFGLSEVWLIHDEALAKFQHTSTVSNV